MVELTKKNLYPKLVKIIFLFRKVHEWNFLDVAEVLHKSSYRFGYWGTLYWFTFQPERSSRWHAMHLYKYIAPLPKYISMFCVHDILFPFVGSYGVYIYIYIYVGQRDISGRALFGNISFDWQRWSRKDIEILSRRLFKRALR